MKNLCIILVLCVCLIPVSGLETGDEAPKFVNPDLQATYVLSKNIIGKGWVILDFFATDCDGCKKELPEIEELYKSFKEYGLLVVVFAVDEEGPSIVKPFFKEHPTELLVVIDRFKTTAIKYEVDEIPALFLVNPEGIIVVKQVEYSKDNVPELKALLAPALLPEGERESETGPGEEPGEILPDDNTQ
jgi:peroxiredoxin